MGPEAEAEAERACCGTEVGVQTGSVPGAPTPCPPVSGASGLTPSQPSCLAAGYSLGTAPCVLDLREPLPGPAQRCGEAPKGPRAELSLPCGGDLGQGGHRGGRMGLALKALPTEPGACTLLCPNVPACPWDNELSIGGGGWGAGVRKEGLELSSGDQVSLVT